MVVKEPVKDIFLANFQKGHSAPDSFKLKIDTIQAILKKLKKFKPIAFMGNSSLFLNFLRENFEFSDIFIGNIRAILHPVTEGKIRIPPSHFHRDLYGDIYIIVNNATNPRKANILGFIKQTDIDIGNVENGFIIIERDELLPISMLKKQLKSIEPLSNSIINESHVCIKALFAKLADNELDENQKAHLVSHLKDCLPCRRALDRFFSFNSDLFNLNSEKNNLVDYRKFEESLDLLNADYVSSYVSLRQVFKKVFATVMVATILASGVAFGLKKNNISARRVLSKIGRVSEKVFVKSKGIYAGLKEFYTKFNKPAKGIIKEENVVFAGISEPKRTTAKEVELKKEIENETEQELKEKDLSTVIAKAIATKPELTVDNLYWKVSPELANNRKFKRYLTTFGEMFIKELSQQIAKSNEVPIEDSIKMGIVLDKQGTITGMSLFSSSGSAEIDQIISMTLQEVTDFIRIPDIETDKLKYKAVLVLEF